MKSATHAIAAALMLASTAAAQVFPGISADNAERDVKKAEGAAASKPEPKPAETEKPPVPPEVSDPAKPNGEPAPAVSKEQRDLERKFKEALSPGSIITEQRAVFIHTSPLVKAGFNDFKDYTSGIANYHAESFARAQGDLIKFTPPGTLSEENQHRTAIWNAAKGGEGLLMGHMAKCYSEFDDTVRSERIVKTRFKNASEYARDAAKKLRQRIGAPWDQDGLIDRSGTLDRFADDGEAVWLACWNAAEKARATPWDFDTVLAYARSLYVSSRLELNIRQRMVLRYLMANFPEHELVKNGEVAVLLSWNLVRTWQFEDAKTLIEKAVEANAGNRERSESLRNSRNAMGQERLRLERGLLKIKRD